MKHYFVMMVIFFCNYISANQTIRYNGEIQISIIDGSAKISMTAVGTVWGSKYDGFPISTDYNFIGDNQLKNAMSVDRVDNWNSTTDAYGYGLYRVAVEVYSHTDYLFIDFRDGDYADGTNFTYVDIHVEYDTLYRHWICNSDTFQNSETIYAWTALSKSPNSANTNGFVPTNPSDLYITNYYSHPKLTWTASDPVSGAKYRIYRNNSLIDSTSSGDTTYIDENVEIGGGSTKTYKIRAISGDWSKLSPGYSNESSVIGVFIDKRSQKVIETHESRMISEISDIYPNPFNPETMIRFTIGEEQNVNIMVFDAAGKEVKILLEAVKPKGEYEIRFNASHLSSGVYYCRMTLGKHTETKKIVLQK